MKLAWLARLGVALALLTALPASADGPPYSAPKAEHVYTPALPHPPAGPLPLLPPKPRPDVHATGTDLFRAGRPWVFGLFPHWWSEGSALSEIARADLVVMNSDAAIGDPSPLDKMVEENGNLRSLVYLETLAAPSSEVTRTFGLPIDPAWWLYRPATKLAAPVSASDTQMTVLDATYVAAGDDLTIDGEHVHVTAKSGTTLTVRRGYFSTAAAHPAGSAAKPHVVAWTNDDGSAVWALNLAQDAPKASNGQRFLDFLVDVAVRKMASSYFWSGIFLAPTYSSIEWLDNGRADSDGNGVADGSPKWRDGLNELVQKIRVRLPDVPVVGRGDDSALLDLNGNVFDVFGSRDWTGKPEYGRWQQQLGAYLYWSGVNRSPKVIAVANAKAGAPDYRDARLTVGAALLGDGALSYEGGSGEDGTTTWLDELDDGGIGMGYLGEPTGPATRILQDLSTNRLKHGGFDDKSLDDGVNGWRPYADQGYRLDRALVTGEGPPGITRSLVLTPTAGTSWRASVSSERLSVQKDHDYVVTFWAKAAAPRPVQIGIQQDASPWANRGAFQWFHIGTQWQEYTYSFTSSDTDPIAQIVFWLGDSAVRLSLANVSFREGNGDFWRREFDEGVVLVNGGSISRTLFIGNGFRLIRGSQDPEVNTGKLVRTITVPPYDARILVKTDELPTEPEWSVYVPGARR